jgi:hypothetical protein
MTVGRDALSKSETVTVAAIEDCVPLLVQAREIIVAFHAMIRENPKPILTPGSNWQARPTASPRIKPPSMNNWRRSKQCC